METNQLNSDSHLPPRKRLLAGFMKLNSNGDGSSSSSSASTHLDDILAARFNNDHNHQSPEELVESARSAALLAVKAAKAARAVANEKALMSAKAIAAAKRALELVDSFPKEAIVDCKEVRSAKKNKQRKHVPLHHLYSKGELRDQEEDLAEDNNGQENKKQKTVVGDGSRVPGGAMNDVVDSDCSYQRLKSNRMKWILYRHRGRKKVTHWAEEEEQ